jgi:hypothetical protein
MINGLQHLVLSNKRPRPHLVLMWLGIGLLLASCVLVVIGAVSFSAPQRLGLRTSLSRGCERQAVLVLER